MSPTRVLIAALLAAAALAPGEAAHARATDGAITPVAGTQAGFAGDGGPATQAQLDTPRDIAVLADGSIVVADFANDRVRRIGSSGIITTNAGSSRGRAGDGGPATSAQLDRPRGVTAYPGGGYLIADTFNNQIRRVRPGRHDRARRRHGDRGVGQGTAAPPPPRS